MQVAQQSRRCLNVPAEASQFLWYTWKFLTQFPHTPDIIWLPCSARSPPHPAKLRRIALLFRQPKAKPAPPPFSNAYIASPFLFPLVDYIFFPFCIPGRFPRTRLCDEIPCKRSDNLCGFWPFPERFRAILFLCVSALFMRYHKFCHISNLLFSVRQAKYIPCAEQQRYMPDKWLQ